MEKTPKPSKTPLGDRLIEIRKKLGFAKSRSNLAALVGLTEPMLGYYERGDRTPDALALAAYRQKFGVSLSWLITGEGDMFDVAPGSDGKIPHVAVDEFDDVIVGKVARVVTGVYDQMEVRLPREQIAVETHKALVELSRKVEDIKNMEEVEALLPWLAMKLRQRLELAKAEPGTGKREAS